MFEKKANYVWLCLAGLAIAVVLAAVMDASAAQPKSVKGFALTPFAGGKAADVTSFTGGKPALLIFSTPT